MSKDMKPSEVLRKARELITPEGAWIQGDAATDEEGNSADAMSDYAVCFCSYGAIWRYANVFSDLSNKTESYLERVIPEEQSIIDWWNDDPDRSQSEILSAFDKAAALAEAEGN